MASDFGKPLPTCTARHTKYQPVAAEWKCPSCGGTDTLYIDETAGDWECPALHVDDYIRCDVCDTDKYDDTGAAFVKRILKEKSMVPCACCKGTGFVPKQEKTNGKR
jgi:hypothetical protein